MRTLSYLAGAWLFLTVGSGVALAQGPGASPQSFADLLPEWASDPSSIKAIVVTKPRGIILAPTTIFEGEFERLSSLTSCTLTDAKHVRAFTEALFATTLSRSDAFPDVRWKITLKGEAPREADLYFEAPGTRATARLSYFRRGFESAKHPSLLLAGSPCA